MKRSAGGKDGRAVPASWGTVGRAGAAPRAAGSRALSASPVRRTCGPVLAGAVRRSTIYRELGRNRHRDPDASRDSRRNMSGYYPITAQDMAHTRRLAKLARHEELLAHRPASDRDVRPRV